MARRYQVKPRFWLTLSVTAALVFSVSFLVTRARLEAQAARVQERIAERDQIVREIGELENEIDFVQTDEYVERAARDELGLIMPGEVRYVNAAGEGQ
ncbi:MAG TPA: septum formation initiator family protein [Candidatus Pullichristensenella avicola]|nr:septum formation initiator family protein [Candidatus Pullichristensenella avicola]